MSLEQELHEGQQAQKVYGLVKDALDHIRQGLHNKWETSKAEDAEGRERAWNMLKALNELERYYLKKIETGKLAKLQKEGKHG